MFGLNIRIPYFDDEVETRDPSPAYQNIRVIKIEKPSFMNSLLNVLWLLFGSGIAVAATYFIIGMVFCCTLLLYPFGLQLIKLAAFSLLPFGKKVVGPYWPCNVPCCNNQHEVTNGNKNLRENFHVAHGKYVQYYVDRQGNVNENIIVEYSPLNEDSSWSRWYFIGNVLWFPFGLILFLMHVSLALSWFVTIIGIPFAFQHIKLAQFALFPFGAFEDNGTSTYEYIITGIPVPMAVAIPVTEADDEEIRQPLYTSQRHGSDDGKGYQSLSHTESQKGELTKEKNDKKSKESIQG